MRYFPGRLLENHYWNLCGFTITLLFLNHFTFDSNSFFNVSSNVSLFLDETEIALSSAKLKILEIFNTSGKSRRNILKIGTEDTPLEVLKTSKLAKEYGCCLFLL